MRFLFATWDGGGNVPPTLALAGRLVARGHAVRILAPRSLRAAVEGHGCGHALYRDVWDGIPAAAGTAPTGRLRACAILPELARAAPALGFARDVLRELEREPADALVCDFMLAGGIAAGERAGVPTAALMHTIYCIPRRGSAPFGPGFATARGPAGRLRDAAFSALGQWGSGPMLSDLNGARRRIGLAPVSSAADQLARASRVLVLTTTAFDTPPPSLPSNVRYVGPQLEPSPSGAPPALSHLPDGPLILVSFSSRLPGTTVVQRALDALSQLPVNGVLTLGPVLDPQRLRLPANVTARRFIPHAALLPYARLAITHAGLGTVMAALAHGVPLLCIPLCKDQFENAARVSAAGAGRSINRRTRPTELRGAILELLGNARYAAAARRQATAIAADEGRAVDELEALASDRSIRSLSMQRPKSMDSR